MIDRGGDVELASAASSRNCATASQDRRRSQEALDDLERVARQRAALQRRLFEKAVGDFGDRAAADIGGAGDRHQVGDQRQRRLAVGAGKGGQHALIFVAAGAVASVSRSRSCARLTLRLKSLISRRRHTG